MLNFSSFSEKEFLEESLNDPIEFYMTDDTKMPKEIYASFEIDGTPYGVSLILTKYDKVYMLDFYRIVNVKKRTWSFLKPTHIRPALSTVIKFMESCYPFIQAKMQGVIIDIPGKTGSEKYVSFLGRILKKSYIKQFREVPVTKTTEKARNYLFLVKKGITPENLFTTATFHKNFKFDNGSAIFDTNIMGQATEPYKTIKPTVSMAKSDKYAFGALKAELTADDETIAMLDVATMKYALDKKSGTFEKPQEKEYEVVLVDTAKDIIAAGEAPSAGYFDNKQSMFLNVSMPQVLATILPKAYDNINKFGYDESKINEGDLKYVASQGFKTLPTKMQDALIDAGMFTTTKELNTSPANMESIKANLAAMMFIKPTSVEELDTIIHNKLKSAAEKPKDKDVKETKLDLEKQAASPLSSFQSANAGSPYRGSLGFMEDGENVEKKVSEVLSMKSVEEWYNNYDPYNGSIEETSLYSYTGSTYKEINNSIRSQVANKELTLNALYKGGSTDTKAFIEYFRKAPVLENGIWVYRNAHTPEVENYDVGDDYIDAAIMSTSVSSQVSMGSEQENGSPSNTRLKIYLPKGTRCFPVFNKSSISGEKEIVLPPFSLLRITEKYENYRFDGHRMFVCTMIGSAFEEYLQAAEKEMIMEQKKKMKEPKVKDGKAKWSDPTTSYSDAMSIKKLVLKVKEDGKKKK